MVDESVRRQAEQILGHEFADKGLLQQALVHASRSDSRLESNERLEFLGDAVLGLLTCELIYEMYPDILEGEMTKIKSTAVSRDTCAAIAAELGLDELLVLGKGMLGHELPSSLGAAVLEAVIAALYLDAGYGAAREFVRPLIRPWVERAWRSGHQQNFKSLLQQHAQQHLPEQPTYRILDEKGPDHAKCFKVAVQLGHERFEAAWGQSKKQAEQEAARLALVALGVLARDGAGELVVVDEELEEQEA